MMVNLRITLVKMLSVGKGTEKTIGSKPSYFDFLHYELNHRMSTKAPGYQETAAVFWPGTLVVTG